VDFVVNVMRHYRTAAAAEMLSENLTARTEPGKLLL
jgi:hypothetical protein